MMQSDPVFKQALKVSYHLLSYRPRTIFEIKTKLEERGFMPEVAEKAIEHLKHLGYLNDTNFARFWVDAKMKVKPVGSRALKRDLQEKGIDAELVKAIIKEKETDYNEFDMALGVAKRRMTTFGKIQKLKAKKRIYDYLIRRGFGFDTAGQVVHKLF